MPTINQLVRHGRRDVEKKEKAPALRGNPQKQGRGMEYNNESRELLLRSEVQARFVPYGVD